ncbi:MAG TPA: hypothetical protein VMS93_03015 [Candidatus Saccharimonadales bacterium]|nr:hypothetical protein [Candidatus Saccharimonadales bacterium]
MKYLISYDLNAPGKDYQRLFDALAALNAKRVLFSQWVTNRVNATAVGLRDHIWTFMDANDRLLVSTLDGTDWAGTNLMFDPNNI